MCKMTRYKNIIKLLLAFMLMITSSIVIAKKSQDVRDLELQILIDVSGSMKEHDPYNIRASALRMLANILPKGANAGIWTFDSSPLNIVPFGRVDEQWVIDTYQASTDDVHSDGVFTNLGDALEASTVDWDKLNLEKSRNVIILTDGIVDVSDDKWENKEARANIMETLLPNYKELGINIHTIALSDKADKEVLEKLSMSTDGLYREIEEAEDLQRVFLDIFEQSTEPDSVPIIENRFIIDDIIDDIILLVFKKEITQKEIERKREQAVRDGRDPGMVITDPVTTIRTPSNKTFDKNTLPANVTWFEEGLVDLITIEKPQAGKWAIIGDMDPDNRALIISNLKLEVNKLPANLYEGETLDLTAQLMKKNQVMTNKELLKYVDVSVELNPGKENASLHLMRDDGKRTDDRKNDGLFSAQVGPLKIMPGQKQIEINTMVKGRTFQRLKRQTVNILPIPVIIRTNTKVEVDGTKYIEIEVDPNAESIDIDNLRIDAIVVDDTGKVMDYNLANTGDDTYKLMLSPSDGVTKYNMHFKIETKSLADRVLDIETPVMTIVVPDVTIEKPEVEIVEVVEVIDENGNVKAIPLEEFKKQQAEKDKNGGELSQSMSNEVKERLSTKKIVVIFTVVLLITGLIGGIVYGVMILLKSKQDKVFNDLTKDLEAEEAEDDEAEEPEKSPTKEPEEKEDKSDKDKDKDGDG